MNKSLWLSIGDAFDFLFEQEHLCLPRNVSIEGSYLKAAICERKKAAALLELTSGITEINLTLIITVSLSLRRLRFVFVSRNSCGHIMF